MPDLRDAAMEEDDPFSFDTTTGRRLWRGHDVDHIVYTDASRLAAELNRRRPRVVGIDGHDGSGKSFLARQLAEQLGARVFELDTFLTKKNSNAYLVHLDLVGLAKTLKHERQRPSIVEGVCLLAALEGAGIKPNVLVYVRRRSANFGHMWHEEDYHGSRGRESDSPLHREIRDYNWAHRPLVRADFLFDRVAA